MIHTFLIQWWMYKSTNKIFNVHKYSGYGVKASLFPLSLAPLPVGSGVVTSTETGNREHLEQMEAGTQAKCEALFTLRIPASGPCLWPALLSCPSGSGTPTLLCPTGACLLRTWPWTLQAPLQRPLLPYQLKGTGVKGQDKLSFKCLYSTFQERRIEKKGDKTTSKCSWSESKCNDLQFYRSSKYKHAIIVYV